MSQVAATLKLLLLLGDIVENFRIAAIVRQAIDFTAPEHADRSLGIGDDTQDPAIHSRRGPVAGVLLEQDLPPAA